MRRTVLHAWGGVLTTTCAVEGRSEVVARCGQAVRIWQVVRHAAVLLLGFLVVVVIVVVIRVAAIVVRHHIRIVRRVGAEPDQLG